VKLVWVVSETIQKENYDLMIKFMKDYHILEQVLEHFSSLIPLDSDSPEFETECVLNCFGLESCDRVLTFLVENDTESRESLIKYAETNYKNPQPQTRTITALSVKIILCFLLEEEEEEEDCTEIIRKLYEILIELLKDENLGVRYFSWKSTDLVLADGSEHLTPITLLLFEQYFHESASSLLHNYRSELRDMSPIFPVSLWSQIFGDLLGYLQKLRTATMVSFSSFIDLFYCLQEAFVTAPALEEPLPEEIENQIHRLQKYFLQELESGLVSNFHTKVSFEMPCC
jgi:hypothetical protein